MTIDTVELLDQLGVAVRRDAARNRRRRRLSVAAVLAAVVLVAGVAVAGTYDDWWTNSAPAVQPAQLGEVAAENKSAGIDLDLSEKATVARTDDAALDAVATNGDKGYCMSLFLDGTKGMGTSCTTVADSEYMTRADDSHWIGYGRILDAGAAALDMSGAGLPARVPLERGGFFLFDIPRDRWKSLDGRSGDIAVLDSSGKAIRTACVFVGIAPPSQFAGDGGLGDKPGTCAALKPIIPAPELDHATRLVALTLTHDQGYYTAGDTIALWTAPNRGGGDCWFISTAATAQHVGGASCQGSSAGSFSPTLGSTLVGDHYANLVQGFVDPKLGAVRAALVGATETLPVSLANGAYLAELPDSPRAGKGPGVVPGGPWRLVLSDDAGREVKSDRLPAR
jgi:hypothetical protein